MEDTYDAAVVGLGAIGSAAACALAERGLRVLGLDRYAPPHPHGSSHGEARMIREAYFEAPFYVPLVRRAFRGWRALEERLGRTLLRTTGGLMLGPPEGELVSGSLASARAHGLPCERLDAPEIRRRFPAFRVPADHVAVLEPRAGYLDPEACVEGFLTLAREAGAELRTDEPVTSWEAERGGVRLRTPRGRRRAARLLLAAGAWTPALVPELAPSLRVERVVQYWFEPRAPELFEPGRCPVYAWEIEPGRIWYGFPRLAGGVKVGLHSGTPATGPDDVLREVTGEEVEQMRGLLERWLPGAAGPLNDASVCLYTRTPDGHFLLDRHPDHADVVVASACSGHGFKFASALGPAAADLLLGGPPTADLRHFGLDRLAPTGG